MGWAESEDGSEHEVEGASEWKEGSGCVNYHTKYILGVHLDGLLGRFLVVVDLWVATIVE